MSITREQAHDILMKYMKGEAYIQHSYAVCVDENSLYKHKQ